MKGEGGCFLRCPFTFGLRRRKTFRIHSTPFYTVSHRFVARKAGLRGSGHCIPTPHPVSQFRGGKIRTKKGLRGVLIANFCFRNPKCIYNVCVPMYAVRYIIIISTESDVPPPSALPPSLAAGFASMWRCAPPTKIHQSPCPAICTVPTCSHAILPSPKPSHCADPPFSHRR